VMEVPSPRRQLVAHIYALRHSRGRFVTDKRRPAAVLPISEALLYATYGPHWRHIVENRGTASPEVLRTAQEWVRGDVPAWATFSNEGR